MSNPTAPKSDAPTDDDLEERLALLRGALRYRDYLAANGPADALAAIDNALREVLPGGTKLRSALGPWYRVHVSTLTSLVRSALSGIQEHEVAAADVEMFTFRFVAAHADSDVERVRRAFLKVLPENWSSQGFPDGLAKAAFSVVAELAGASVSTIQKFLADGDGEARKQHATASSVSALGQAIRDGRINRDELIEFYAVSFGVMLSVDPANRELSKAVDELASKLVAHLEIASEKATG